MKQAWKNVWLPSMKAAAAIIMITVFFRTYFFSTYVVEGKSMAPTLQDGNLLVVNKVEYKLWDLHRFDVIVFHANEQEDYVKRIIGLPGDTIQYENDKLYVNGVRLDEPYLEEYKQRNNIRLTGNFTLYDVTGETTVPPGYVFVLGDNRLKSWDSRHFGFVKAEQIVGKVDLRYWPLETMNAHS